jgi:ankyrin
MILCSLQKEPSSTIDELVHSFRRVQIAELLLQNGGNVNAVNPEGYTCLMMAASLGEYYTVEMLLKNGAKVKVAAEDGTTALSLAEKPKHTYIALLLRDNANKQSEMK